MQIFLVRYLVILYARKHAKGHTSALTFIQGNLYKLVRRIFACHILTVVTYHYHNNSSKSICKMTIAVYLGSKFVVINVAVLKKEDSCGCGLNCESSQLLRPQKVEDFDISLVQ